MKLIQLTVLPLGTNKVRIIPSKIYNLKIAVFFTLKTKNYLPYVRNKRGGRKVNASCFEMFSHEFLRTDGVGGVKTTYVLMLNCNRMLKFLYYFILSPVVAKKRLH